MSWNYRIVRYKNDSGFGLHEVFYDEEGKPWAMTVNPINFSCDFEEGIKGVRDAVLLAAKDTRRRPVLKEPNKWPGKAPSE